MAGYGSYQNSGGYLGAAQENMGYATVMPGEVAPSRDGYGAYVGEMISEQDMLDRARRNVAESRVAMRDDMKFMGEVNDFVDREIQRPMRNEEAAWAHEAKRMDFDLGKLKFQKDYGDIADALEEADLTRQIKKEQRSRIKSQADKPLFAMLTDLYEDGEVSQDSLADYNAMAEQAGKAKLSGFVKDPENGELYGIAEDGKTRVPFSSTGLLDAWAIYHPQAQDWAISAYPEKVRESKRLQYDMFQKKAQDEERAKKTEAELADKERRAQRDTINKIIDNIGDELKEITSRLDDGVETEEERVQLENTRKELLQQRRVYSKMLPALIGIQATPASPQSDPRITGAQGDAQAAGVSTGGGAAMNYTDYLEPKKQQ